MTLVTTTKYLIGAEVLAKSLRALAASRPLVALVDATLPVWINMHARGAYSSRRDRGLGLGG